MQWKWFAHGNDGQVNENAMHVDRKGVLDAPLCSSATCFVLNLECCWVCLEREQWVDAANDPVIGEHARIMNNDACFSHAGQQVLQLKEPLQM